MTDVLPSSLTLIGASATSGTAVANVGTNTVTWNGSIPKNGSVTVTINATIKVGTAGTTISNQASIAYDEDGNGTNEASATSNVVSFTPGPASSIPALSTIALLTLAASLALLALMKLRFS
jgi:outer membrane protein assembly factor BamB